MIRLDPATVQTDVTRVGEDAYPQFCGQTPGDVTVAAGGDEEEA